MRVFHGMKCRQWLGGLLAAAMLITTMVVPVSAQDLPAYPEKTKDTRQAMTESDDPGSSQAPFQDSLALESSKAQNSQKDSILQKADETFSWDESSGQTSASPNLNTDSGDAAFTDSSAQDEREDQLSAQSDAKPEGEEDGGKENADSSGQDLVLQDSGLSEDGHSQESSGNSEDFSSEQNAGLSLQPDLSDPDLADTLDPDFAGQKPYVTMSSPARVVEREIPADSCIELKPYITGGRICYKTSSDSNWIPVEVNDQATVSIPEGASYRITINYRLPEGCLSKQRHILRYQLPQGIKVYPDSGTILEGSNLMGSYQITKDGQVTLDFNDQAIQSNQDAPIENGLIRYRIDLQNTVNESGNRDVPYEIGGKKLTIHLKLVPSLDIKKSASSPEKDKNIDYTITVSSSQGTDGEPVSVTDTRLPSDDGSISLSDARDITVYDESGQKVSGWTLEQQEHGFTITGLPALNAGQHYTIKYKASLKVTNGARVTAINQAQASSGSVSTKPYECRYTYSPSHLLSKSGQPDGNGNIDWTIEVNKDHDDIGGWTLEDAMDNVQFSTNSKLEINPPVKVDGQEKSEITVPFTFPKGDTSRYTITYQTPDEYDNGSDYTVNTASLSPPNGGQPAVASATVHFTPNGSVNQMEKSLDNAQSGPDGTEILTWNLNITPGQDGFQDIFSLTDMCTELDTRDQMYFTGSQMTKLLDTLEQKMTEYGLTIFSLTVMPMHGRALEPSQLKPDGHYKGFMLDASGSLEQGENLNLQYQTTVKLDNLHWSSTFTNQAIVICGNTSMKREATWHWENSIPVITKVDTRDQGPWQTSHSYDDTKGIVKWSIRTQVPDGYTDQIMTIKDFLPEGLNLSHSPNGDPIEEPLSLTLPDGIEFAIPTNGSEINGLKASVYPDKDEWGKTVIEITFTQAFFDKYPGLKAGDQRFEINIAAGLDKEPDWNYENGKASISFLNRAKVYCEDGQELSQVSQLQSLTHSASISRLTKSLDTSNAEDTCFENNVLPYSLTVNPKGEMLGSGGTDLTVSDCCTVSASGDDPITLELINGSLQVGKINKDGSITPLSPDQYKYVLESKNTGSGHMEYRIVFTLPDGMPLHIDYSYLVNGTVNAECTITNQASMDSSVQGHLHDSTNHKVTVCSSSATVESIGVTLYKTAEDNTGLALPGAQFELKAFNPLTGQFETVKNEKTGQPKIFETDTSGSVEITSPDIQFGVACELQEVKAPDHYAISDELYKFIVVENSTKAITAPEGFINQAQVFRISGNIYIGDKKTLEDVKVTKQWVNEKNEPIAPPVDSIGVELYHLQNGREVIDGKANLGSDDDWQHVFKDLPVYNMKTVDGKETVNLHSKIDYYLREIATGQGAAVGHTDLESWSWKVSRDPADPASFILTNTVTVTPVRLPKAGSSSWLAILAAAAGAFTLAFSLSSDASSKKSAGSRFNRH